MLSLGLLAVLVRYTLEALVMRACRRPLVISPWLVHVMTGVDVGLLTLLLLGGTYCLGWL